MKKAPFDPSRINTGDVSSDEVLAGLVSEYTMRFTGFLDRPVEITFQDVLLKYKKEIETRRVSGTPKDGKPVGIEYTGLQLRKLLGGALPGGAAPRSDSKNLVVYGTDRRAAVIPLRSILGRDRKSRPERERNRHAGEEPGSLRSCGGILRLGPPGKPAQRGGPRFHRSAEPLHPRDRKVPFADGYSTSLTMEELRKPGLLLGHKVNGEPFLPEHGFPFRVVAPEKYGMKWAKWITRMEFVDYVYKGFWEEKGWSDYAGRDRPDKRFD